MAAKHDITARHHAQRYPIDPTALLTFIGLTDTKDTYLNFSEPVSRPPALPAAVGDLPFMDDLLSWPLAHYQPTEQLEARRESLSCRFGLLWLQRGMWKDHLDRDVWRPRRRSASRSRQRGLGAYLPLSDLYLLCSGQLIPDKTLSFFSD